MPETVNDGDVVTKPEAGDAMFGAAMVNTFTVAAELATLVTPFVV